MGTYGPDLLDDPGQMPKYREPGQRGHHAEVRDLIRASRRRATEQPVAKAGLSRKAKVFATGVSSERGGTRDRAGGRRLHRLLRRRAARPREPVPFRIEVRPGEDRREVARRRLHPGDGSEDVNASWYDLLDVAPDASETEIRAAWRARDRRPRPDRPQVPGPQPGGRGAARPAAPGGVRRGNWRSRARAAEQREAEVRGPAVATSTVPRGATALPDRGRRAPGAGFTVPAWLLAGAAVLTAAAVGRLRLGGHPRPSDATVARSPPERPECRRARDRADPVLRLPRTSTRTRRPRSRT